MSIHVTKQHVYIFQAVSPSRVSRNVIVLGREQLLLLFISIMFIDSSSNIYSPQHNVRSFFIQRLLLYGAERNLFAQLVFILLLSAIIYFLVHFFISFQSCLSISQRCLIS